MCSLAFGEAAPASCSFHSTLDRTGLFALAFLLDAYVCVMLDMKIDSSFVSHLFSFEKIQT